MALNSGKILMRRGQEANFDPNKMIPGEWAVSLDSKFVRMCFSPGVCIRMATYEAFEADMEQIQEILAECQTVEEAVQRIYEDIKDVAVDVERIEAAAASALKSEENALNSANSATQSANTATQKASDAAGSANIASTKAEQATEGASTATQKASEAAESADNVRNMSDVSESYAVGGTGTREGEDTDNAKYYNQQASDNADRAEEAAERASAVADVEVATTEKAGLVKPDGDTIRVDPDGTIHADRPIINDVELVGNKTLDELGIASKEALEETDNKVNIIIENAELRFKETASGENIHLDDSADSKIVEFALYGKSNQNTTSGKNLLPYPFYETTKTASGITFTDNGDGTVTANGTATATVNFIFNHRIDGKMLLEAGEYIVSGCPKNGSDSTYRLLVARTSASGSYEQIAREYGNGTSFTLTEKTDIFVGYEVINGAILRNLVVKPMVRLASITDNTYEPYTGGIPSPNPDYPQEIAVAGESGSVEVKSVGKNLLPYPYYDSDKTSAEVTFNVLEDGSIVANGTSNSVSNSIFLACYRLLLKEGNYILSGCPSGGSTNTYRLRLGYGDENTFMKDEFGNGTNFTLDEDTSITVLVQVFNGYKAENLVFKPMIRLASDTDTTYEAYKSKTATIQTENGLAGIPVDSDENYTDQNGQQWICDEIVKYADGSGEKIQRVGIIDSYSTETITGVYMSTTGELTEGAKILYQLAKPIRTPLTQEQLVEIEKLSTFYPVTNISNDFDCGMKVKYIVDSKNYIDNQLAIQAKLQEEALLNMLLLMPEEVQASMIENDTNNLLNESEV